MVLFILLGAPLFFILIQCIGYLFSHRQILPLPILRVTEIASLLVLPFLYGGFGDKNDCCDNESAVFSPNHQLTMLVIILLCLFAYFFSSYRKKLSPPIIEVLINSFICMGILLNFFIAYHTKEMFLAILGNLPIILLGILILIKNQRIYIEDFKSRPFNPSNKLESIAFRILNFAPILKFPILFLLCLPLLLILTTLLLLFGQKPDSLIRAFTDTYKHGFSQWDYKCDNVSCGGHYLCSVAAKGHTPVVKPIRYGIRHGQPIICNRQLLVSNAFEDLIQENMPTLHKFIRKQYNKVGYFIHRYYGIFNNKFVADIIYYLMKPIEIFFLIILYTFDKKPENRIARQYVSVEDKTSMDIEFQKHK